MVFKQYMVMINVFFPHLTQILLPTLHLKELRNEASTLRMAIAKQCQQILLSQVALLFSYIVTLGRNK